MIRNIDTNGDGELDFDEFINVLKETSLMGNDNFLSQNKKRTKSNGQEKVKFPKLTAS